jgi:flagellar protein FlbD
MIETVESTPDTVITLVNGKKYVVTNDLDDVIDQIVEYKARLCSAGTDTGQ